MANRVQNYSNVFRSLLTLCDDRLTDFGYGCFKVDMIAEENQKMNMELKLLQQKYEDLETFAGSIETNEVIELLVL